jgi:hypothetical protein
MKTTEQLSLEAQTVIDKVRALRAYTLRTGWRTTRSQNDLIQGLADPNDLASVLLALQE